MLPRWIGTRRAHDMTMLQHGEEIQTRRHGVLRVIQELVRGHAAARSYPAVGPTTRARVITEHPKITTTAANAQDRWPPSAVLARRNNASRWQSGKPGRGTYQQRRHGTKEGVACQKRRRRLATFRTIGTVESGWRRRSRVRAEGQRKKGPSEGMGCRQQNEG